MARYRVLEKSYIGNALRNEGDEIEFDGEAGPNLQLLRGKKNAPVADEQVENPSQEGADQTLV